MYIRTYICVGFIISDETATFPPCDFSLYVLRVLALCALFCSLSLCSDVTVKILVNLWLSVNLTNTTRNCIFVDRSLLWIVTIILTLEEC